MARNRDKKKSKGGGSGDAWLVTFSDLVTLLLTFFVLLLSMSTLDTKIITVAFRDFDARVDFLRSQDAAQVETKIELVTEMLKDPSELLQKQDRFKDLLFPDEALPQEVLRSTLEENLEILEKPEGVALVLNNEILFSPGSSRLAQPAQEILARIAQVILATSAPVNISGHTDNTTAPGVDNYRISARRAMSVLDVMLGQGIEPDRFSISGYGPDRPLASNETSEGRQKNRRVEILLKTKPHVQTYL
ncbi:MAG: OmpA/MotB family protein [Thermodesulfobacteriota bacterium]